MPAQPKNALAVENFLAALKSKSGKSPWLGELIQAWPDEECSPAWLAEKERLLKATTVESKPKRRQPRRLQSDFPVRRKLVVRTERYAAIEEERRYILEHGTDEERMAIACRPDEEAS